jgi:hypothetical protein
MSIDEIKTVVHVWRNGNVLSNYERKIYEKTGRFKDLNFI